MRGRRGETPAFGATRRRREREREMGARAFIVAPVGRDWPDYYSRLWGILLSLDAWCLALGWLGRVDSGLGCESRERRWRLWVGRFAYET